MAESAIVVGAGTMGHGIAQVAAAAGFDVTLVDVEEPVLARAMEQIRANVRKGVEKGKLSNLAAEGLLGRIHTSPLLEKRATNACLVVEAVPEKMELKTNLFRRLDECVPEDCILATNTSSLSVTEIAAATRHPDRVVGMHFFNPPHIMPLVEVVRGYQTSDATIERTRALAGRMGKEVIVVADCPGFATSRLGIALGLEAIRMVEEGVAAAEDIDRAMELGYRHPMGPLKLTDLVGLDVRLSIAEYLHRELGMEQFRPPRLLRKMVLAGKLGRKSGEGFYKY